MFADVVTDALAGSVEAAHDRSNRDVEEVGRFLVSEAVEIDQFDDLAKVV